MSAAACIFCRIIRGEIPSPRLFEDDRCIVIRDIQPQAKTHLLVVPKKHIAGLDAVGDDAQEAQDLGHLLLVGTRIAHEHGLMPRGFRTVINTGPDGGQSVFHLHAHILGGEKLSGNFA